MGVFRSPACAHCAPIDTRRALTTGNFQMMGTDTNSYGFLKGRR